MTRRTAVVLKVARLQESAARGAIGRALVDRADTVTRREQARDQLAAAALPTGPVSALLTSTATRAWRAEAAASCDTAVTDADDAVQAAVQTWQGRRQRSHLLSELDTRQRLAGALEDQRRAQRLADDLSATRRPAAQP